MNVGPPRLDLASYLIWYDLTRMNVALDQLQHDLFPGAVAPVSVRDPEWLRAYV